MPSPLGHALGGIAAGWLISPAGFPSTGGSGPSFQLDGRPFGACSKPWVWAAALAAAGMAPDLDLLVGLHSRYTHSVGAALLVFVAALVLTRRTGRGSIIASVAIAASYASHILLDWLASDSSPPIGIMALWPFSSGFYLSDAHLFGELSRRFWITADLVRDLWSLARELVILVPLTLTVLWLRRPGRSSPQPA